MTYDPLSYGQIKLNDRAAAPGDTPDDLLFEDAGPVPQADEPEQGNTDWELLADAEPMQPDPASAMHAAEFGADVLGETAPMGEPSPTGEPSPMGASPVGASPMGTPPMAPAPAPEQALPEAPSTTRKPVSAAKKPVSRRRRPPLPRPSRLAGLLVPLVVIAGGGSGSAWLYMMEQNMIMAGLVGAISLVGAALARVMFR